MAQRGSTAGAACWAIQQKYLGEILVFLVVLPEPSDLLRVTRLGSVLFSRRQAKLALMTEANRTTRTSRQRGIARASQGAGAAASSFAAAPLQFIHLKVHSSYSLLEGALQIGKLVDFAKAHDMPALALTDTNNLFGALEFSNKMAGAGIQPIVGISLALDFLETSQEPLNGVRKGHSGQPTTVHKHHDGLIALLAMDEAGYHNLMKLASRAYEIANDDGHPHIRISDLKLYGAGLIAMTGGPDGPIDRALLDRRHDLAAARLDLLHGSFGDRLYIELQRHHLASEAQVEPRLLDLAYAKGIPLVATNEAYFATPDDYEAHDALTCIADGRYVTEQNRRRYTAEHFFKSQEQMAVLFADLPEATANTIEIAQRCHYRPLGKKPILPKFVQTKTGDDAAQVKAEAKELAKQAKAGLKARLKAHGLAEGFTQKDYTERLDYELGIIAGMKFPGYFLIVADFIKWSKSQGIPVGPGRGSGAGSVVAWALTITDLDPLRFGLLFERFLNPERISMPDFDIDFCQDRRDEVIQYVQHKYGEDRVAQIITHGKLQARAVLRDVGRVLQMPYGQVDRLCKLVPNNPANPVTLPEAIAEEPRLGEEAKADTTVAKLLEMAQKLEGLYRHASTHAAGMVIGDRPLDELVPMYRDPKSNFPITQFNWKMVEAAGLVKFDFLGLKTLTVLQKAVEFIKRRGIEIDLSAVPLDDKASFDLLARADTAGVFQLESTGMRESLRKLKPDRFEDIIAMVALYRPGPMDNIPTYINRKHGEEPIDCLHPMLEPILKETYGVIIYQEQVIQIAQVMGGYSLGKADILRRAMGKKDKAEMALQQAEFVKGAVKNNVKEEDAAFIFELVDKFAGYGFNKSHAAAYALVAYHTAYLKANFPVEFMAATMTLDMGNTDKLAMFAGELRKNGIDLLPPCVNHSGVDFEPEGDGIRYSLAALKNIGEQAVESLTQERADNGLFKDLADFARRLHPKILNKRGLETLAAGGAFDALEANRAMVHGNVGNILALANRIDANNAAGTSDLFGTSEPMPLDLLPKRAWTPMERLTQEFDAVGFFLSGHPLDEYENILDKLGAMKFTDFEQATTRGVTSGKLAAIVVSCRERKSAKGNAFAFAAFSDATGSFEAVVFSDTLDVSRDVLTAGTPVLIAVEADRDEDSLKLRVLSVRSLDEAAEAVSGGLRLIMDSALLAKTREPLHELRKILHKDGGKAEETKGGSSPRRRRRGGSELRIRLRVCEAEADIVKDVEFGLAGRFDLSPAIKGALQTVPGVLAVEEL